MAPRPMTGLILAGGRSLRMGADKAAIGFEGEPLASRVARRVAAVCDEVIVASGDGERLSWLHLPQVADVRPGIGPLGGLIAGLEAASNDLVAVVAVDMPFASGQVLRLMADLLSEHDAAVPVTARGTEPLHAVYAASATGPLRASVEAGTRAVRAALEALSVRLVPHAVWREADPSGSFASNVNRPEDLDALAPPGASG